MFRYINEDFSSTDELFTYYKISKSNIYKLYFNGLIEVNGSVVKSCATLKCGDTIIICDQKIKNNNYIPWKKKIDILYEDEDIVIVYKESGMLVHPDSNTNETLINALSYYYKDKNTTCEHLHRLDLDTTGMLVCSKNMLTHSYLSSLFEERCIEKHYVALVKGKLNKKSGVIDKKIGKDRHSNRQIVSESGKSAKTKYEVLKEYSDSTLLDIEIEGGRRHQIRVHLAYINHPIIGDQIYNSDKCDGGMMLKFYKVKFVHPRTKRIFSFEIDKNFR